MKFSFLVVILFYYFDKYQIILAQNHPYRHYSRQVNTNEKIYDNQTSISTNDDSNMCHLSVRCPAVPKISSYERDNRNRRFTVDTFLAMHGPPGPPGLPGPAGSAGLRGAVGPQGKHIYFYYCIYSNGISFQVPSVDRKIQCLSLLSLLIYKRCCPSNQIDRLQSFSK